MKLSQKLSQTDIETIDRTQGVHWHANRVRINLLLPPEVVLRIIVLARFERVSHWIARRMEDIITEEGKEDLVQVKLDKILEMLS